MDITQTTVIATMIVGVISPAIVQITKTYIPAGFTELWAVGLSLVLGVLTMLITASFANTSWTVALTGVVGISQIVYSLVNKALGNNLSKNGIKEDHIEEPPQSASDGQKSK